MDDISWLTREMVRNPGASTGVLRLLQEEFEVTLPDDYMQFLKAVNGAEGPIGPKSYLRIWPAQEIVSANIDYNVEELAPGLVLFGTNGGGEAFAFDTRSLPLRIVQVPFEVLGTEEPQEIAETFVQFLQYLYSRTGG